MTSLVHLARRFAASLTPRPPVASDREWALSLLSPAEADLWQRMAVQDRRHSILVARRFLELCEAPVREEVAAALLHDVGKLASGLGTFRRVLATVIGGLSHSAGVRSRIRESQALANRAPSREKATL